MPVEDDIQRFGDWALSMGFPSLPPKNVLTRVFSSGQSLAFEELMRRIRPRQEVQKIRDEMNVKKIECIRGTMVSAKRMIPEQLQLYQKKKKMDEQLSEVKSEIDSKKKEFKDLLALIKTKNIQKMQLKEQIVSVSAKHSIYRLKINEIEQQQAEETELVAKIDHVMPVKFDLVNGKSENAETALAAATVELQKFYVEYDQNNKYEVNAGVRSQLWENLNQIFSHIPNVVLWTCLSKQMGQKVSLVETLSKTDLTKSTQNQLNLETGKLYAKHMRLYIQKHGIIKQSDRDTDEYVVYYNSFLSNIRAKFSMYNSFEIDDDLLADFLTSFSALHYIKGEMEFMKKIIADNDSEIQRRRKVNEDYRSANDLLRQIYGDIESSYIRVRDDLTALVHVKDKIIHSKNCMQYLLQCTTDQQHSVLGSTMIRTNRSGNNSLNSSGEGIFHTTMSDSMDNTRSENTFVRPMPVVTTPNYANEIKAFMETSIESFKAQNMLQYEKEFGANPLIRFDTYNSLPDKVKTLISDHLIRPGKSLEQLACAIDWVGKLEKSLGNISKNIELPIVDESQVSARKRQQDDEIAELCDKTAAICANANHTLSNIRDYINLFKNNPLAKFIPNTKLVEGKSYQEYEREFMMYYNMIKKE